MRGAAGRPPVVAGGREQGAPCLEASSDRRRRERQRCRLRRPLSTHAGSTCSDSPAGGEASALSRRGSLLAAAALLAGAAPAAGAPPPAGTPPSSLEQLLRASHPAWPASTSLVDVPNYAVAGPCVPARLPPLEHTASSLFPACVDQRCLLKLQVVFPRGGPRIGLQPPFPLAVLSPGFLIEATQLSSYADRLASWGYTCVLWDATQQALDPNTDVLSAAFIREVISWAEEDSVMRRLADTQRTFLVGHSRGGKISVLAAATDPRVKALLLLDPVDVTKWAPETPDFPSAVAALRKVDTRARPLPLAVVASQLGPLDCAPPPPVSFFDAAASPAWEVVVQGAGHLQFLDHRGGLMDSLCAAGEANDAAVREVAQAAMVVWAEMFVRPAPRGPRQASAAGGDGGGGSVAASSMSLRVGLDADGNLVAGVGSFDAMRRLFATEEAARTLLVRSGKGGGGGLQLNTRLKNFSLLEAREGEAGA